jgi:hypothetical protein
MDPATFTGRRGIEYSSSSPALLRGWRLAIDKPSLLGIGEAMATIVRDAGAEVWGVLYEISADDFEHLELTEGVRIGHYERTEIVVELARGCETRAALTLASDEHDATVRPTTRYMDLLIAGALAHKLPESWLAVLRAIEAVEESAESAAIRVIRDGALKKQV